MVNNLLNTSAVQRLRGIIKSRYGKGLNLRFVVDSNSINFDSATPIRQKGDLLIPILMKEHFLGLATIPEASDIKDTEVGPLADMIRMVLEPTLHHWYLENQPQNTIDFDFKPAPQLQREGAQHDVGLGNMARGAFLQSQNPYAIPRWALTIHDSLGRWAFLHFTDLGKSFRNIEEIRSLGAVTLLIDDVALLSPTQEKLIAEFMATSNPETEPLILIGSNCTLNEVLAHRKLDDRMTSILSVYQIDLDRLPGRGRQMEDAIRLLLDGAAVH